MRLILLNKPFQVLPQFTSADERRCLREFVPLTFKALPALMMPVVLLGGIYSGVMTPTEAAAVAARN